MRKHTYCLQEDAVTCWIQEASEPQCWPSSDPYIIKMTYAVSSCFISLFLFFFLLSSISLDGALAIYFSLLGSLQSLSIYPLSSFNNNNKIFVAEKKKKKKTLNVEQRMKGYEFPRRVD